MIILFAYLGGWLNSSLTEIYKKIKARSFLKNYMGLCLLMNTGICMQDGV
jgi:hypothetical protein